LTELLDAAVNRLGVGVSRRWAHEALSIPVPAAGEAVLAGENMNRAT
jgi:phage gp29-like protein